MLLFLTNKDAHDLKVMLNMAKDYEYEVLGIYNGETEEKANNFIKRLDNQINSRLDKEDALNEAIKKH